MFWVYGKEGCKFCAEATALLRIHNQDYKYFDINVNPEARQLLIDSELKTVPQIWEGHKHIGGYEDLKVYLNKVPKNMYDKEEVAVDANVESVRRKLRHRSQVGLQKYGVTTERNDTDLLGWLQHLQEELMDAAVYVERLMRDVRREQDDLK